MDPYKDVDKLTEAEAKVELKKAYRRLDQAQTMLLRIQMQLRDLKRYVDSLEKKFS